MSDLWRFTSWDLTMFTIASEYNEACRRFKMMMGQAILDSNDNFLLDEIIEIVRLDPEGRAEDNESGLEFTEEWLKDIGLGFDIISIRC